MTWTYPIIGLFIGLAAPASADFSAFGRCWNVGAASVKTDVTVGFEISDTGALLPDSIVLVGVNPDVPIPDGDAVTAPVAVAFQLARRAIIRCYGTQVDSLPTSTSGPRSFQILFSMTDSSLSER